MMSEMCHVCGSGGRTMDEDRVCWNCGSSSCGECDKREETSTHNGDVESLGVDVTSPCSTPYSTPYGTPLFSRVNSFSSFASCLSSLGDSPMDTDSEVGEGEAGFLDTGQPHLDFPFSDHFIEDENEVSVEEMDFQLSRAIAIEGGVSFSVSSEEDTPLDGLQINSSKDSTKEKIEVPNVMSDVDVCSQAQTDLLCCDHSIEKKNGGSVENMDFQPPHAIFVEDGSPHPISVSEIIPSNRPQLHHEGTTKENTGLPNNILDTDSSIKLSDNVENGGDNFYPPVLLNFETDPLIWIPPEPANEEDDVDSVGNNDDNNDNDSARWGQSNFSSTIDEERSNDNHEEVLQKAMSEVMNGQFKVLVGQLLAAEGFSLSEGKHGNSWLDIVASLSWDAALLVKLDPGEGKEMDPGSYVKVKCIASGTRRESEVTKGLVFKKNAALKQMRTNIKNPRFLLLVGGLGHSLVGLSSMNSMKQEKEQLERSINEMIEACHPDVILVEKTVARDVHEYLQKKGVTVVSDMNLCRLERISRCTGFPIMSLQDVITKPKVKQCEWLHFEKFTEEHNTTGEDGRRSTKTLMFLEGLPKPLGCTILLKGASSEELKKIKHVMHYTIFAAYHLILETSFFADQRVFLTDKNATTKENYASSKQQQVLDIPISDGKCANGEEPVRSYPHAEESQLLPGHDTEINSMVNGSCFGDLVHRKPISGDVVESILPLPLRSGKPVSESSKTFLGDKVSLHSAESISSFYGFDVAEDQNNICIGNSKIVLAHMKEGYGKIGQEKLDGGTSSESALDPRSILLLMSSKHITKQEVCEQSHLSRIKYYGNFDMSLGRYLRDTLLNKRHTCLSCGDPPEAHMYSYTHHNGTLTVLVRSLHPGSSLSGEVPGKIWMWTRCLRCKRDTGNASPTQRVVISSSARNLSFGKFLELSFSSSSAAKKLSRCGHLLHRDCLRFFGLGSKVAMFRYSSVEIYSASKPPLALEFHNPNRQEWLGVEVKNVLDEGRLIFSEVESTMWNLGPIHSHTVAEKNPDSAYQKVLSRVMEWLMQEKSDFEASLEAVNQYLKPETCVHEILVLNGLYQQLLLAFYVWDRRLHHLCQFKQVAQEIGISPFDSSVHESTLENGDKILENSNKMVVHVDESSPGKLEMERDEVTGSSFHDSHNFRSDGNSEMGQLAEKSITEEQALPFDEDPDAGAALSSSVGIGEHVSDGMQVDTSIQIVKEHALEKLTGLRGKSDEHLASETFPVSMSSDDLRMSPDLKYLRCEDAERWIWNSFSDLQLGYKRELQSGSLEKLHLINKHTPSHLSLAHQKFKQQMGSLLFTVGPGGNILSISEEEISSIIACALAISEEQGLKSQITTEKEELEAKIKLDKVIEKSSNMTSDISLPSSMLSSTESLDYEGNYSSSRASLLSFEETTSGFDKSFLSDLKDLHPEISLTNEKVALKSKYIVVSIYAKQFYALRKKCCPSELAYISSLSRCKKWNAQGGKSKALFAKSMDDRFIIKQIKKTEFDSFLKFGPRYFKYVTDCLESRSPTCLAKILGIYQVREMKNGKEIRTDLMVMENLLFGHKISRRYDLKGALFSRYVSDKNNPEKVLLDQNFVEDMHVMPVYLEQKTKILLQRAIWNDTSFLTSINVMDYSLFVGVDKQRRELVFGIIDYLRQYTWDKQLETWVKTSLVVPKNVLPTVISPKEYRNRFRKFITKYFPAVPDTWNTEQSSTLSKSIDYGGSD